MEIVAKSNSNEFNFLAYIDSIDTGLFVYTFEKGLDRITERHFSERDSMSDSQQKLARQALEEMTQFYELLQSVRALSAYRERVSAKIEFYDTNIQN